MHGVTSAVRLARDTRAGNYERNLQTKAGEVRLRVPKLRQQTFETAIIERYRRRESSVEEATSFSHASAGFNTIKVFQNVASLRPKGCRSSPGSRDFFCLAGNTGHGAAVRSVCVRGIRQSLEH
jgi:hypothetical protein